MSFFSLRNVYRQLYLGGFSRSQVTINAASIISEARGILILIEGIA